MNKIMKLYWRIRYGPHCLNQYTNDDINTAALKLLPKEVVDFRYYKMLTIESCLNVENRIAILKQEYQKEHPRMRKQLLYWLDYFQREVDCSRKLLKHRKIGDVWVSKEQIMENIIRCVGR